MNTYPLPALDTALSRMLGALNPLLSSFELARSRIFFSAIKPILRSADRALRQPAIIEEMDRGSGAWLDIYLSIRMGHPFGSMTSKLLKDDTTKPSAIPRAASLILGLAQIAQEIANNCFAAEVTSGAPLEMEQYKRWLFCSERRPARGRDHLLSHPFSEHVVVMVGGGFYVLPVFEHGQVLSANVIAQGLRAIVKDAAEHPAPAEERIGRWTILPREDWSAARGLIESDLNSRKSLAQISNALFVVSLDLDSEPTTREELANLGRTGNLDNRWFDKGLQLIVFANGKALFNIDHAGLDGSIIVRVVSDAYRRAAAIAVDAVESLHPVQRLRFQVPSQVATAVEQYGPYLEREKACRAVTFLDFLGIRKQRWKTRPLSSDAVVQLAIQRAALRTFGELPAINNSVQVRSFEHGRVESYFTVTPASRNFLLGSLYDAGSVDRLRAAAQAHRDLIEECRTGQGVFNYFYALLAAQPPDGLARLTHEGLCIAGRPVVRDRGYDKLMSLQVITTNLSTGEGLEAPIGADAPMNVFELPYLIKPDRVTMTVKASGNAVPKMEKLKSELMESLELIAKLADQAELPSAKE